MTNHSEADGRKDDVGLDRLLFFSDGVFAIAITLLSIELHPPQNWDGTFNDLWARGWPMLCAFALSFLVIGIFWNSHRRIFTQIRRFTHGVFLLNLLLLGAIALMPFVTNLLYVEGPRGGPVAIYLGLVAIAGLLQGLMLAWAVFVSRSVDPQVHVMRRISAILAAGLLPGLAAAVSLLVFAGSSRTLLLMLGAGVVVLVAARVLVERRFQ